MTTAHCTGPSREPPTSIGPLHRYGRRDAHSQQGGLTKQMEPFRPEPHRQQRDGGRSGRPYPADAVAGKFLWWMRVPVKHNWHLGSASRARTAVRRACGHHPPWSTQAKEDMRHPTQATRLSWRPASATKMDINIFFLIIKLLSFICSTIIRLHMNNNFVEICRYAWIKSYY